MSTLPSECGIAVRDWSPIVDAIAEGKQVMLLRRSKPAYNFFLLLPTYTFANEKDFLFRRFRTEFHAFVEKSIAEKEKRSQLADCFCRVEKVIGVGSRELDRLRSIKDYYIWTADHVLEYFQQEPDQDAFVWILRAYRLPHPHRVSVPRGPVIYVHLDSPLSLREITPVVSDFEFAQTIQMIETKLSLPLSADMAARLCQLETRVAELTSQLLEKQKRIEEISSRREPREAIDDVIAVLQSANEQDFLNLEWAVSRAFRELGFNSRWNGREQDGRPVDVAPRGYPDVEVEAPLAGEPYYMVVEATKLTDANSQATELSRTNLHALKSTGHKTPAAIFRLLVAPRFTPQVEDLCQGFKERVNLIGLDQLIRILQIHRSIGGITQEEFRRLLESKERGLISPQVVSDWEEAVRGERENLALLLDVYSVLFENPNEWMTVDTIYFVMKKEKRPSVSEGEVAEAIGILKAPVIDAVSERIDSGKPKYKASMTPQTFQMRIRKLDELILRNRSKTELRTPGKISSYTA